MAKIKEIWEAIPGWEGLYEASNLGQIRSLTRRVNSCHPKGRIHQGRIIRQGCAAGGSYLMVSLQSNKNTRLVHRLIAETFIPNPENKPCVNHIDGNKNNNAMDNLSWVTYSENELHSYRSLGKKPNLNMLGKRPHNAKKVRQYKNGKFIKEYKTATHAAKAIGASQGNVSCCARGEYKSCRGFQFKYAA